MFTVDGPDAGGFICVLAGESSRLIILFLTFDSGLIEVCLSCAVVSTDLWKFGQIRPGDKVRFTQTNLEAVSRHRRSQRSWLNTLRLGNSQALFQLDHATPPGAVFSDGVLFSFAAESTQPSLSYRQSSDSGILVEVGSQDLRFATRLLTELWERRLRALNIEGIYSFGQGAASLLVRFDPVLAEQETVLSALRSTSQGLGRETLSVKLPSRLVHLPVVFDDSVSRETIARYVRSSGRSKAVYLPSNIDYLAKASGLDSADEVVKTFTGSDWYVSARAFFCGLPMMSPVSQHSISLLLSPCLLEC